MFKRFRAHDLEAEYSTDMTVNLDGPHSYVNQIQNSIKTNIIDRLFDMEPAINVINCTGYLEYKDTDWVLESTARYS